jgi:hypothetical protein
MALNTGFDYFMQMPITDLVETVKEAEKVIGKRKRK